jgi:hypothetical protein
VTRQKRSRRVGKCKRNGRCLTSPARIERRLPMARLVHGCLLPLQLHHHHATMAHGARRAAATQLGPGGPAGAVGFRSACGGAAPCRRVWTSRRQARWSAGRRVAFRPRGNGGQNACTGPGGCIHPHARAPSSGATTGSRLQEGAPFNTRHLPGILHDAVSCNRPEGHANRDSYSPSHATGCSGEITAPHQPLEPLKPDFLHPPGRRRRRRRRRRPRR